MAKKHRKIKGVVKFHGATFKLIEPGKFVRAEPERKPKPRATEEKTLWTRK
jgi:hypothetical protein